MGGGGGDAAASTPSESATPATTGAAAPAAAAAATPAVAATPAAPAVPDPVAPWVEAAQTRKKIPLWAVPVLALLPLWAVIYAVTLDPATPTEPGPAELGAEVYAGKGCSGCHGAGGAGAGAVPALTSTAEDFPKPADMVRWVALGTVGYQAAGIEEYAPGKPVGAGGQMPAWADSLTAEELMAVVLHERTAFGGETFDAAVWEDGWEESLSELLPQDKVDEYTAVLEEWKADPPA
jgi:mono/diheme cytochrome c family protein